MLKDQTQKKTRTFFFPDQVDLADRCKGRAKHNHDPFELVSQRAHFNSGVHLDAASNAASTQWSPTKTQRLFI